ncbi:hypothetical protein BDV06DRAFT_235580 [Aspergillus oleicola]
MSSISNSKEDNVPPPPPPPQNPTSSLPSSVKNLKTNPDTFFRPPPSSTSNTQPAPTGLYFFYGTLSDPGLLRDILNLKAKPQLRPAKTRGYKCKTWGKYPALLQAPKPATADWGKSIVKGFAYHVERIEHAERLAEYETSAYRAEACEIEYTDGEVPKREQGFTFMFVGNPRDLTEEGFGSENWLRRPGRP